MEKKLKTFVATFHAWDRIVGLNWCHAGGVRAEAMSADMVATPAKLNEKSYATA
jgi:hypothetical protein